MHRRNVSSPLSQCALGIVLLALFGSASSASVIYEYRELSSAEVRLTLEIREPPASISHGWSTADASDLISLFVGSEEVLLDGGNFNVAMSSSDGSELDGGELGITFATIVPSNPADPIIDRSLRFSFEAPAGEYSVSGATYFRYPDGAVIVSDLFLEGDWTAAPDAAIPEPGTFALLGMGLLAAGRSAVRRRAT